MSAVLQSPNLFRGLRDVSEPEAITTISRLSLTAGDAARGLEAMACTALRLAGLHGVEISLHGDTETFAWHTKATGRGSAAGLIAANSREWGRLRILFEPRTKSVECPLRFARFLAQQTALMLNRLDTMVRNEAAKAAIKRLAERLDARKAVSRAAGVLAAAADLAHEEAVLLLLRRARMWRRPVLCAARAVILGVETGHLRRLSPDEKTSK